MTLKERIEEYCKYAKIRISAFERRAGLSNGYFNQVKKEPSPSKLSQIEEAFPDLNTDWMLTEKGSMLKTTNQPISQESDGTTPSEVDPNNLGTMKNFFDALERRDREIEAQGRRMDRLITIIERMSGVAGAEIEALKKEG